MRAERGHDRARRRGVDLPHGLHEPDGRRICSEDVATVSRALAAVRQQGMQACPTDGAAGPSRVVDRPRGAARTIARDPDRA